MAEETLYRIALTRIKGIGPAGTKKLVGVFGDARSVFRAGKSALRQAGATPHAAAEIVGFCGQAALEEELQLLDRKGIRVLFFTDKDYPNRLQHLSDAPSLLFYKGDADLNAKKVVAVVGTRIPTSYGREVTAQLIHQMAQPGMLIISGLALGIDAAAHKAAMDHRLPTVGVLGHGFGHLYPRENRPLAAEMLKDGGLLTELAYSTQPEAYHFPDRNLIVAALCDALLVVETAKKGGSLLTVKEALRYGRKVFAVPGRITDTRSAGCNELIRQNQATMLTSGKELTAAMGWSWPPGGTGIQRELPLVESQPDASRGDALRGGVSRGDALGGDGSRGSALQPDELRLSSAGACPADAENTLVELLKQWDSLTIDEIAARTGFPPSSLALLLLRLELKGAISTLPGKRYRLHVSEGLAITDNCH